MANFILSEDGDPEEYVPLYDDKDRTPLGPSGSERLSEDTVKFDTSVPEFPDLLESLSYFDDLNTSLVDRNSVIKDETLLLFDCMPKGLESFLETGPSRRVVDYMDYEKLCAIQKKKIEFLKEQMVPQDNRARDIHEKSVELQEHFKNFDVFISDAQKKRDRAAAYYIASKNANRELNIEIPKSIKKLEELKEIRDELMTKVIKFQPVDNFIESFIKLQDSQFLNFNAIMDRNFTLRSTNKYLTKRFTERHLVEKQLIEELQATKNSAKTHDIFMRREIYTLKKTLQRLTKENMDLELKCNRWSEMTTDTLMTTFLMTASIKNMARTIMQVRPFTKKRLENVLDPCDVIDMVGLFISDYTNIVSEAKAKKKPKEIESNAKILTYNIIDKRD